MRSGLTLWFLTTALALVVVAAPAGATTTAPAGGIGLRLAEVPVSAGDDPRARLYIVDHLAPGTVIQRQIEISNTTRGAASVVLYAAAATLDDGSFIGADGHTANELSTWTSVDPAAPAIPAGEKLMATVTITVPSDAAPGEQYGVVWAEARSANEAPGGVTQVTRVGIRLYVSVGPGGAPAPDFTIDSLTAKRTPDGQPMILATVRNTGGRALDMNGTLQLLAGPAGLSAGPFPATLGTTLAIGDTEKVTIALDESLPAGPWDARITLRSGLLERSARATITFPDVGVAAAVPVMPEPRGSLLPAMAVLALLLVIAATLVVVRQQRHPHPEQRTAEPRAPRQLVTVR